MCPIVLLRCFAAITAMYSTSIPSLIFGYLKILFLAGTNIHRVLDVAIFPGRTFVFMLGE
jgi:hypothetical protein